MTNHKTNKRAHIALLIAVQIVLTTLGWVQDVSLPEPPQVRAKSHVVSLTLHAVNENGRDAFIYCVE